MSQDLPEPRERRPEDFDADFDALVSGLELDGDFDELDPLDDPADDRPGERWGPLVPPSDAGVPDLRVPADPGGPSGPRDHTLADEPEELSPEDYKPAPVTFGRPSTPAVIGWVCLALCLAVLVTAIVGVTLPGWIGYLGVGCFIAAMAILLSRLPKNRDPSDGDGAVL